MRQVTGTVKKCLTSFNSSFNYTLLTEEVCVTVAVFMSRFGSRSIYDS